MRTRVLLVGWLAALSACGPVSVPPDAGMDAGISPALDAGSDAGLDAGQGVDAGFVTVKTAHSLFWVDPLLLDDPQVISFAKVMGIIAADGHGGKLLDTWFRRFNSTPHSERALPAQFVDALTTTQGADPSKWALGSLMFKVTGVHNRIDLADFSATGHCGELRVSLSSEDPTLTPFHILFLFRQPALADDKDANGVHCTGTARRWADLSLLDGEPLRAAVKARWAEGFTRSRFMLAETVENALSPWEWRQWLPDSNGVLENPPLFQQVDVVKLNAPGAARDEFLLWVKDNAPALDARTLLFPEKFRVQSVKVTAGATVPRPILSLSGLDAPVAAQFPMLRQNIEVVGCAACHTADADFVHTATNRTVSPFYEKELLARERHLEKQARGEKPKAPFGPLQAAPVLPK